MQCIGRTAPVAGGEDFGAGIEGGFEGGGGGLDLGNERLGSFGRGDELGESGGGHFRKKPRAET